MLTKFTAALLSTFVFSRILTFFYYDSVGTGIILPIIAGAYILGGIMCSILIDKWTKSIWKKLLYFIIAGFVVGILTILVFILTLSPPANGYSMNVSTIINGVIFGLHGSIGALIFYLIELLLKAVKKRILK